ncbi:MAG: hypothetical protein GJ679_00140 [Rhodobacteraceae bacterium]|jgi:hypothetical protein|nr:hypothetical protein [Paracoccaceae bacterium]QPI85887.1 hypothetical protein I3V23_02525 [Rhodobacterales bacterium HKCCA1288]
MSLRRESGSRFLYDPFDIAEARIEANERVLEERWQALTYRLGAIETAIERLEKRLWLAVFGIVGVVLAEAATRLIELSHP